MFYLRRMLFFTIILLGDIMIKMGRDGFTLIEVLAVIVIISIIGAIAAPNVLSSINASKEASEKVLADNIKTAALQLYEEYEFQSIDDDGEITDDIDVCSDDDSCIQINLEALVKHGFLKSSEEGEQKLINPRTGEDIGNCVIEIKKITVTNGDDVESVKYEFHNMTDDGKCPKEY